MIFASLSSYCYTLLTTLTIFGSMILFFGIISLVFFHLCPLPKTLSKIKNKDQFPGISIIKPCHSADDNEGKNFDSFFNQNYPGELQLIFVVSDIHAPIIPIIENYLKRYPHQDAKLVISKTRNAYSRKVDALYDGNQHAKHDWIILSDSDTVVNSDYVMQMANCLAEKGVSVVTTPQYDFRVNNFATAFKVLGNNAHVGTYVMLLHWLVSKKKVAFGQSIGFKKSEFKKFEEEGWRRLNTCFGDDLVLPTLFAKNGKKVVFRNIYCPVEYSNKTFRQMRIQQERFALCQKVYHGTLTFILSPLLIPQIPATLLLLFARENPVKWSLFFGVLFLRITSSFLFEKLILKSVHMSLRYFWTIPLWDLYYIYLVVHATCQQTIEYHGVNYLFSKKRDDFVSLTPLKSKSR